MKQLSEAEMLHRAAAYCSAAERCIQDVEKKTEAAGLSEEATARIIARLVSEKFIDESRYTRSFINDKLHFGKWGRIKIAYELHKKGIPPALRLEALAGINEEEYRSTLFNLLKDKKKSVKGRDERDTFNKLLRFAAGRGYESREAVACLKQLFKGNDYEDDEYGDEDME
ncbi:MAG: regulatory protein RecX [Tannerellaceae bacterium]